MGGKVSLILVMSFSVLFAMFGRNILNSSVTVTDNFSNYYSKTRSQSIAISGANMAINNLYLNKNWMTGYSNKSFANGKFDVTVDTVGWDSRRIISTGVYYGDTSRVEILLEPENFALFGNFYNVLVVFGQQLETLFKEDFTQMIGLTVIIILYSLDQLLLLKV